MPNSKTDPPPPAEWAAFDSEEGWLAEYGPDPAQYQAFILSANNSSIVHNGEDSLGIFDLEDGDIDIPPIPLRVIAELMTHQGWTCVAPVKEEEEPPEPPEVA